MLAEPVRVRHAIGVVAQRHGLDPEATGRENLTLQGEFYAITGADLRGRVGDALDRSAWSMPPTGPPRPTRRHAAPSRPGHGPHPPPARALLDEPTTGLDPEARADIWHEIERLARDERMTIMLTTHYLEEADRLASQLAIVDRGRIVAEGSPDAQEPAGGRPHPGRTGRRTRRHRAPALAGVDGVGDAALEGRTLHARARDGAAAIPAVLAALDAHGVKAASVTLARPSLDDVYLRHAGRSRSRRRRA